MPSKMIQFRSSELQEKSLGLRFDLPQFGEFVTGFVIRFDGKPYAYVNQCAHVSVELDWQEGDFFAPDKTFLMCATHGAQYEPDTGYCVYGPCKGRRLQALRVTETDGVITIHLDEQ